jgi:TrmH family RNA methyltransferase
MALLSTIRDLHRRKGRERRNLALAEGIRLVEEMLAAAVPCKGVACSPALEASPRGAALKRAIANCGVPVEIVADSELVELAATEHPQGVVAVYQPRAWTLDSVRPAGPRHPLVVLDSVQDPGNVGTIARTAWAFGASGLVALPGTADLTSPKTVRSAMGALFQLPHLHAPDADVIALVAASGAELWVTSMQGEPVHTPASDSPVVLVFGNEGAGVRPDILAHATRQVTIPMHREAESLNVATAAAIVLYEVTR